MRTGRNENIVRLRMNEGKTLQEIADVYGISKERVRQIVKEAVGPEARPPKIQRRSPEELFFSKVDKDSNAPCWEWTGYKTVLGYGVTSFQLGNVGGTAHRLSWYLEHGPIPSGMNVCHTCGNRACVNPAHLYLGTRWDARWGRDTQPADQAANEE